MIEWRQVCKQGRKLIMVMSITTPRIDALS
jgi:hypothetical protein